MAELKKCPFCGSDKLKIEKKKKGTRYFAIAQLENYTASVRCNVCHARGGAVSGYVRNRRFVEADNWLKDEISIEELDRRAIELWNNRATEAEIMAKAISEFQKEIRDWQIDIHDNEYDADKFDFVFERIYEIAEQLKECE